MPYFAPKPRYEILDGLRGVAAYMVVIFHLLIPYKLSAPLNIFNHGYLAVDFFFALSGYVIGYAYDNRWGEMNFLTFAKRRIIRLHPMVILGCVLGAMLFYMGGAPSFTKIATTPVWMVLVVMLAGMLMIPILPYWDIRGVQDMSPLNGPQWSLFWEYFANILYGLFIRKFSKKALIIFVVAAGILTVDVNLNIDITGILHAHGWWHYYNEGGMSIYVDQLYIGLSRLLYPFFVGLLLSRIGTKITVKGAFWWCSLVITIIMAMPTIGSGEYAWLNGLYGTVIILAVFPLMIVVGAGSEVTGSKSLKICKWLGAISYPIYIIHCPVVYVYMNWVNCHHEAPVSTKVFVSISVLVLVTGMAYAALKLYDEPVRAWLTNKVIFKGKR